MKNLQELKISANSVDSLWTMNLRNQQKLEKTLYYLLMDNKILDYFLTDLQLVPKIQKSRKLNQASFLLER